MQEHRFSCVIICRETFVRESVSEALVNSAVDVIASLKFISDDLVGDDAPHPDLVLYIDSGHSGRNGLRDAEKIALLPATNWLVLCDDKDNDVYNTLRDLKLHASAAPLDISREDLAYLASLASRSRRIFIDEFCEPGPSDAIREIRNLGLEPDQWELLRCLSEGHSNKVIAKLHNCSEATVKVQIRALLNRLSVSNRTQAAVLAARAGLRYEPPEDATRPESKSIAIGQIESLAPMAQTRQQSRAA